MSDNQLITFTLFLAYLVALLIWRLIKEKDKGKKIKGKIGGKLWGIAHIHRDHLFV